MEDRMQAILSLKGNIETNKVWRGIFLITLNAEFWKPRLVFYYKWPTIPDKTTWESFPHHVHFPTQQNSSKTTPLWKENPFPQFNVASHKRPGIRLSFEYTTTLLSGEGGEGRTGTATMFRKMLSKYTIFSTVLSKIVANLHSMQRKSCSIA